MQYLYLRHFKGKYYRILHIASDSEKPEHQLVVYQALYGEQKVWVRDYDMFFQTIERDGRRFRRFEEVSEEEALCHTSTPQQ